MEATWSDIIRGLEDRGWSLVALGARVQLSPQGLSDIKHGRTKAPNGMVAVRLHALFDSGERADTPLAKAG